MKRGDWVLLVVVVVVILLLLLFIVNLDRLFPTPAAQQLLP